MNFTGIVKGLHHVTATVSDAREDYDFYTKLLGLRLVKETVNFDNENVYHFYYANEIGLPSTVFTTFPYKDQGVRQGVAGSGQVYETAFSVPEGALPFWRKRLEEHGVGAMEEDRFGLPHLLFEDPSGLKLSILEDGTDDREPVWTSGGIAREHAIPGIHHVTLAVEHTDETIAFLKAFGYQKVQAEGGRTLMAAGSDDQFSREGQGGSRQNKIGSQQNKGGIRQNQSGTGAGNSLVVMQADGLPRGVNGLGTVHHVAHRVAKIEDSLRLKSRLEEYGLNVTEVKDRKYFKSIYFRIPGGVLFEVATEGPGFMVDESREELGSSLRLPDRQEPRRKQIEENLMPYK